jgi:hypothetical protein
MSRSLISLPSLAPSWSREAGIRWRAQPHASEPPLLSLSGTTSCCGPGTRNATVTLGSASAKRRGVREQAGRAEPVQARATRTPSAQPGMSRLSSRRAERLPRVERRAGSGERQRPVESCVCVEAPTMPSLPPSMQRSGAPYRRAGMRSSRELVAADDPQIGRVLFAPLGSPPATCRADPRRRQRRVAPRGTRGVGGRSGRRAAGSRRPSRRGG